MGFVCLGFVGFLLFVSCGFVVVVFWGFLCVGVLFVWVCFCFFKTKETASYHKISVSGIPYQLEVLWGTPGIMLVSGKSRRAHLYPPVQMLSVSPVLILRQWGCCELCIRI